MKITTSSVTVSTISTNILVFPVTQKNWKTEIVEVAKLTGSNLEQGAAGDGFEGKTASLFNLHTSGSSTFSQVLLIGLGESNKLTTSILRKNMAAVARWVKNHKVKTAAILLTNSELKSIGWEKVGLVVTEGLRLGSYFFDKYKSEKKEKVSADYTLVVPADQLKAVSHGVELGELYAEGTMVARDLINEPPTITTPTFLASVAKKLASKDITVEVMDKKEVEKMGMHSYLSVSRGSDEPPKFIKLVYKGGPKKVVIAGKAITFDSGGLSIKDSKNMETMKLDMSGGAAVLGLFSVLPKIKPNVTVIGLIAATENMPGPNATKPGDIVKAMNGKTIEILNTDAEGRLTLADVLSYAVKEKPAYIIDLATLTGACMVALGEEIAGMFSNDEKFTSMIKTAAADAGEKVWELPLEDDYRELIKSHIADVDNIGKTRYGGAITAALFLEEFVDKTPWIHLDIAGPAYAERPTALNPKGGVGFGVRTLLNWVRSL